MVMVLAQDGSGFPFFANTIYEYICGKDLKDIDVDIESVPDGDAYFLLRLKLNVYHAYLFIPSQLV